MNRHVGSRPLLLLAALAALLLAVQPSQLSAQARNAQTQNAPSLRHAAPPKPQQAMSTKPADVMNAWTVGLAGGLLEGAPIRLAAEMARVVDDGDNLHVLPVVTRGPTENVNSLLYLHGIDLAIINSDSLDEYKRQVPDIQRKVTSVLNLFPSELHVFVRPEIQSLGDLAGKKVNFNTQGTAAAYSGPLIFSRLGLDVEKTFVPHQVALEQMRKGEGGMAAVVFVTSKPVDAFVRGRFEPGFKFLSVPYDRRLEDYYLPTSLDAADYPGLIKQGERVDSVAVPTALVAFNWQATSNRYDRVARFVEHLFSRLDKLQGAAFDPKWRAINLAAPVPGLARFPAAQAWLDEHPHGSQASQ
ncbi:MAG TPA: C4-dicarboxylate ABC transporter substrate-binding protein [Bradyrhizobium sp.]|nr:C4-dicarboxylate ABC transporter substrate-binding protein [Bradyrhizobium sp.]